MTRLRRRVAAFATVSLLALGSTVVIAGAVQAVPAQPEIVDPSFTTSSSVEVTVDVKSIANTYMTLYVDGVAAPGCINVEIYYQDFPTCTLSLTEGIGEYDITAITVDGDGDSPLSDPFTITYGGTEPTTLTEPGNGVEGTSAAFSGTGPALGSVVVSAIPTADGIIGSICGPVAVSSTGTWSCPATFPDLRTWNVSATGTDVAGTTTTSVDEVFETRPGYTDVDVTATPGYAQADVTGITGSSTGVSLYTDFGGETSLDTRCPEDWTGSYDEPLSSTETLSCWVQVPSGIHLFSSVQFINDVNSSDRGDLIRVPEAPTLDAVGIAGGLQASGTVAPEPDSSDTVNTGSIVHVYREVPDDAPEFVCSDAVDTVTGAWECGGTTPSGDHAVYAFAQSTGFADDPAIGGNQIGYHDGISAYSSTVNITTLPVEPPGTPDVDYAFGPGSVSVTATGDPLGGVAVEVYEIEIVEGDPDLYGDAVDGCPILLLDEGGDPYVPYGDATEQCSFTFAPGIWNFYIEQEVYDADSDSYLYSDYLNDFVLIPSSPTISASLNDEGMATFSGSAEPGFIVRVHDQAGTVRCSALASSGGAWSCAVDAGSGESVWRATQLSQGFVADPPGEHPYRSFQGISPYSAGVTVTVPAAVAPTPIPTPTPSPTPLAWSLKGLTKTELIPGETITLESDGLPPGATIDVVINSTPRALGSTVVGPDGSFSLPVTIPLDMEPGSHTLVVTLTPAGGVPSVISQPVAITPVEPEKAVSPEQEPKADAGQSATSGGAFSSTDRSDPGAPSALTESVATWRDVIANPMTLLGAAGLGLALLLLVAFPAELLNSTLSSNSQRLGRGFAAIESAVNRATTWFISVTRTPALAAAVIVLITSVLFGFVDPDFGFDVVSLRLVLSLGIGLFIVSYVASFISSRVIKRAWGVEASIQLQPAALVFAALGVIVARALDFSPGFLVGLVIGLEIALSTREPYRSRAIVTHLAILVGISVLAWVGFSLATAMLNSEAGFVDLLVLDALAATTVEGLTAATVALLPLGFLEGRNLFLHSKRLWFVTFAIIATLFCLLVLPTASGDSGVRDWLSWTLVLLGFAVVTLSLWAYFHFTGGRRTTRGDDPVSFDSPADDPMTLDRVDSP